MTFTWQDGAINQLTASAATISVTLSAAISAGDLIICVTGAPSFVIGDVSDTAGNTWVKIGSTVNFVSMFAAVSAVAAAGGTTITVAHTGSSGLRYLSADRFSTTAPAAWTGQFSSSTATGTSGNCGSIAGDPGGNLLFATLRCGNASLTFTAGASNGVSATSNEQIGNTGGSGYSEFVLSTATGTQSMTWSASGTVNSNVGALQATFGTAAIVSRPVPAQRRKPGRGQWRGIAGQQAAQVAAPRQQPAPAPRRRPVRAWVQFTPVRTVNAVPAAAPSGTVQPRATVPVPRRPPGRGMWRGTAVPGVVGVAPRQQYGLLPRRVLARAYVRFIPVVTVNAVPAGAGRPASIDDAESRLIRRYRHMLRRHDLDWEPEVSMMAAPVAFAVPPGWPGTWPVHLPTVEPEPARAPERAPEPAPKWRPVYTRPPKVVRARHVPRDAMMPVWRKG